MISLEKYIENEGAILSEELAKYIVTACKFEEATARKRIERLKSPVHKLKGFFSENSLWFIMLILLIANSIFKN